MFIWNKELPIYRVEVFDKRQFRFFGFTFKWHAFGILYARKEIEINNNKQQRPPA